MKNYFTLLFVFLMPIGLVNQFIGNYESFLNRLSFISEDSRKEDISKTTISCPQLIWSDEFTGNSLDATKWTPQIGDGCPNLCGWGNSELQYYRSENAVVANGTLRITAKEETFDGRDYTSARIRTINKGDWTYGRFEASIKLPEGQGLWPAFWMLPTESAYGSWPQSGEIDIMEYLGQETDIAFGTLHYGPPWPNNKHTGAEYRLHSGGFDDDFHEFAIEWDQTAIKWYIDDYLFSTKTAADLAPEHWPFDKDFYFILNLAVGGNLPGSPDGTTNFPQTMEVDYVRVYNGQFPSLIGKVEVLNQAVGEIYTIENAQTGTTYNWSVPTGATIVSGQGTHSITVNWGGASSSGIVSVALGGNVCEAKTIQQYVNVAPGLSMITEQVLENFDLDPTISYKKSNGVLQEDLNNPSPDAVNGSTLVGKYSRKVTAQYDALQYVINTPVDATALTDGDQKFYIDIYSNAPVGTTVIIQLEDDSESADNYPSGRHSRYKTVTTVQNAWERLAFDFIDRPDASVASTDVDNLLILFASNSYDNSMYYFDNFEILCVNKAICMPMDICETTKNIDQNDIDSGIYRAEHIFSKGTVQSGEDVQFLAENAVLMEPGFQANAGSIFLASIEDCPPALQEEHTAEFLFIATAETEAYKNKMGISIYPNPVHSQVRINLHKFEQGQLQVLDGTGKVVIDRTIFDDTQIDLSQLHAGIYFLQVRAATGKVFTRKVMKQQ